MSETFWIPTLIGFVVMSIIVTFLSAVVGDLISRVQVLEMKVATGKKERPCP